MVKTDNKLSGNGIDENPESIKNLDNGRTDYAISQNIGGHMVKEDASRGNCGAVKGGCGGCRCHTRGCDSSDSGTWKDCNSKKMLVFIPIGNSKYSKVIVKRHGCSKGGKGCCENCSQSAIKDCSVVETKKADEKC